MQMTSDGYLEPMPLNPAPLGIGALITVGGVALSATWSMCAGAPLVVLGLLWGANAWGKRRVRVTRTKLLIEEDPLIRGFLIGPHRDRVLWDETESVEVEGDCVRIKARGGRVVDLAKGASAKDLENLIQRVRISMELHADDQAGA